MSRTKRDYGHEAINKDGKNALTWKGIDPEYNTDSWRDIRNPYYHGRDGSSPKYYYITNFPGKGWRENVRDKSRAQAKRRYSKSRRSLNKVTDKFFAEW